MRRIVSTNPDATKQYLTPDNKKMLLIIMGIKLALGLIFAFMMPAGEFSAFSNFLLWLLMFSFIYDLGSFYQVCLQIAQSIFFSFLLFLVLLLGGVFIFQYGFAFLASVNPSTEAGQNFALIVMALIFLIPLITDVVRLIRMLKTSDKNVTK